MEFEVGAAIIAELVGGTLMAVLLYMGIGAMPTQMRMTCFSCWER